MCLAIPGQLTELFEENGLHMGRLSYDGVVSTACLEYLPDARVGQYVLVHAGFGISVIDEDEARRTLALLRELLQSNEEGSET